MKYAAVLNIHGLVSQMKGCARECPETLETTESPEITMSLLTFCICELHRKLIIL